MLHVRCDLYPAPGGEFSRHFAYRTPLGTQVGICAHSTLACINTPDKRMDGEHASQWLAVPIHLMFADTQKSQLLAYALRISILSSRLRCKTIFHGP